MFLSDILDYISILGCFTFSISGAITAMRKNLDVFGIIVISFVTAVGGGTLRDTLLTDKEVFWLTSADTVYYILAGSIAAMVFRKQLWRIKYPLLIFDAIGLGLFSITGVQIGLDHGLHFVNCLILGAITGSFGGVIRDILVNEIPVIFQKEVYATIALIGGALYLVLSYLNVVNPWLQIIPILTIISLRLIVIFYKIPFPKVKGHTHQL
ncbi:MAG: trimeric intracellular cation channel family protein [Flavobacteriales bacterium]|nr:trimeric intracellular cation channel family protein [Flavobacteriales bacterium]